MNRHDVADYLASLDEASFVDIIDALEQSDVEIAYFSPSSGLVCRHLSGLWYVADTGLSDEILSHLPLSGLASVHGERSKEYMTERLGYESDEATYLYHYRGGMFECDGNIVKLGQEYLDTVVSNYHVSSAEDVRGAMLSGHLFGMLSQSGDLMAFAGFHAEGSMGMLTVFPQYRREGLGMMMEKKLINTALEEHRRAYCNVFLSNQPSIRLQEKLGLVRGRIRSWWIWK